MTIMPEGASWIAYALLLVFLTAATLAILIWKPRNIKRSLRQFVQKVLDAWTDRL